MRGISEMLGPLEAAGAPLPPANAEHEAGPASSVQNNEQKQKIRDTYIPNNCRISVFTIYSANFVYWVGFVTGLSFTTHL